MPRLALLLMLFSLLAGCAEPEVSGLDSGGLTPPPGFFDRTNANCRAAAIENDLSGALTDTAPTIRQLNGQSLFGYTLPDGRHVQCVVRHADEHVVDVRVIGSD